MALTGILQCINSMSAISHTYYYMHGKSNPSLNQGVSALRKYTHRGDSEAAFSIKLQMAKMILMLRLLSLKESTLPHIKGGCAGVKIGRVDFRFLGQVL